MRPIPMVVDRAAPCSGCSLRPLPMLYMTMPVSGGMIEAIAKTTAHLHHVECLMSSIVSISAPLP